MDKGFGEFLLIWWRQPFEFDWTARHLRARGLLRIHQVFIGAFSLLYGFTALLTVLWGYVVAPAVVLVVAVSSVVLGAIWIIGPWPTGRQSAAFAIYADVAVFAITALCVDAFTAMPGLALLAANGIYIVVVHGPRALSAHLLFTILAFAYTYGLAMVQATAPATVITVRLLVLLPTVVGVPVIVQSYLLALRVGAVDSLYDPLTRLYNRRGLDIDIEELVPAGRTEVAVLAIDIDKFKAINDGHGHDAGDRVLVAVANATRDAVSSMAIRAVIARTGGEEFVVVIDGGQRDITQLAELLHAAVARSEVAVVPTVSIGVATARAGADDVRKVVRRLIARADAAMYRAKNAGGNQTVDAAADDSLSGGLSATD